MVKISQSALVQQSGNDIYFIIEGPCDGYFTEKVSQAHLFWKSSFVHDTQLPIDLAPVPDGSCPFLSSLESGQI